MKCDDCRWLHSILPSIEAPYGEYACFKLEQDLYGCEEKDVKDCKYYEQYPIT